LLGFEEICFSLISQMASKNNKGDCKNNDNRNKGMTEYILRNPVSCGYLLVFCEAEHNAENLNYVMEVDNFKDKFSDPTVWRKDKDWIKIDNETNIKDYRDTRQHGKISDNYFEFPSRVVPELEWPSRAVNQENMLLAIKNVWEEYLSDDSPTQICLSSEVLRKTKFRIEHLHIYGPQVFGETLLDPIKTIRRDILPRFMKSPIYRNLNTHLASTDPLPIASSLVCPSPPVKLIFDDIFMSRLDSYSFILDDMLCDKYLFEQFLNFLKAQYSAENLLCVRMINIFEEKFGEGNVGVTNDQAWEVYKYFVAPGSAFEVSCSHPVRKRVMLSLGKSSANDFQDVKKSALVMLAVKYESFQSSSTFAGLKQLLRNKKSIEQSKATFIGKIALTISDTMTGITGGEKQLV
jgi:Regulator of G protein signaling domain